MEEGTSNNQINNENIDPLEAISYSAEPGDVYYMNPPKALSTYPMYIDNPKKLKKQWDLLLLTLWMVQMSQNN